MNLPEPEPKAEVELIVFPLINVSQFSGEDIVGVPVFVVNVNASGD